MELNKIYRYHGVPEEEYYSHPKEKFTEAFTGFEGVSFETVEGTDETTEEYKIYLDSEKSMWLTTQFADLLMMKLHICCFKDRYQITTLCTYVRYYLISI